VGDIWDGINNQAVTVTASVNLADFFTVDTTKTYADAVAGSVVKGIADHATLADGVAHGGTLGASTATFAMQQVNVTNPTGTAVLLAAATISGSGAALSIICHNGAGVGIVGGFTFTGTGHDMELQGDGILSGSINAVVNNVTAVLADNVSHGGYGATLALGSCTISNLAGSALALYSVGAPAILLSPVDGNGIDILPTLNVNPSAVGINIVAPGTGIQIQGDPSAWGVNIIDGGMQIQDSGGAAVYLHGANFGLIVQGGGVQPDISLTGSGLLQADLGGRILGNTATAFAGIGAQVAIGGNVTVGGYAAGQDPGTLVLDELVGYVANTQVREALKLLIAALGGKASGLATNLPKYRDRADTKDVISAVTDSSGDRTTVTLDLS